MQSISPDDAGKVNFRLFEVFNPFTFLWAWSSHQGEKHKPKHLKGRLEHLRSSGRLLVYNNLQIAELANIPSVIVRKNIHNNSQNGCFSHMFNSRILSSLKAVKNVDIEEIHSSLCKSSCSKLQIAALSQFDHSGCWHGWHACKHWFCTKCSEFRITTTLHSRHDCKHRFFAI